MFRLVRYYAAGLALLSACTSERTDLDTPMYKNDAFALYPDRVEQGEFVAKAHSATRMTSTYRSPAQTAFPSTLVFKLSLNGKDNEAPAGVNHELTLRPENGAYTSPVVKFGERDPARYVDDQAPPVLPPNTQLTLRADLRHVLAEMDSLGYYTTYDGQKVYKKDFDGVYVAGGVEPLTWDFDNLAGKEQYQLTDDNGDGIYELELMLNEHDTSPAEMEWRLTEDVSAYPQLKSTYPLLDALYNMSLQETVMLSEDDSTFRTGAKWPGVWTRDISYSVLLAYAYLDPERTKASLRKKLKDGRIVQDTGSGGAWPVSTDRMVWALAAWEVYVVTGDEAWLEEISEPILSAFREDLAVAYDQEQGLFRGESSFMDWREQTYPRWMDNVDISQSFALSTNVVFARAVEIAQELLRRQVHAEEGVALPSKPWQHLQSFFVPHHSAGPAKNLLAFPGGHTLADTRSDALGAALLALYHPDLRTRSATLEQTPVVPFGVPCIYPQIPNVPPYHNNGIWPFVQAYYNWAAAQTGHTRALKHGLASLFRAQAMFLTNKENMVADNGDFLGTQVNSDRQLWSVAGSLAMFYRVLLGMHFAQDGLYFSPFVPEEYTGKRKLTNFSYRDANLTVIVEGYGSDVASFQIDGVEAREHRFPADLAGQHTVFIILDGHLPDSTAFGVVDNRVSLETPSTAVTDDLLQWAAVEGATAYAVHNQTTGATDTVAATSYPLQADGVYTVVALNTDPQLASFPSSPRLWFPTETYVMEMESRRTPQTTYDLVDYEGQGAVYLEKEGAPFHFSFTVPYHGSYLLSFRYANGTGPWNTDNNCALRLATVDGQEVGTLLMPQRGQDEWSNWGWTNHLVVDLKAGRHVMELALPATHENMDGTTNEALLDQLRMIRLENE